MNKMLEDIKLTQEEKEEWEREEAQSILNDIAMEESDYNYTHR